MAIPLEEALAPKPLVPNPIVKGKTLLLVAPHDRTQAMITSFAQAWGMNVVAVGTAGEAMK